MSLDKVYMPLPAVGSAYAWRIGGQKHTGEEGWVVTQAISHLLDMGYQPIDLLLEYRIDPCCRVDIAVVRETQVLLIECKRRMLGRYYLKQALRYRDHARARWPDRQVLVVLAGEGRHPYEDPDGIVSVAV